MIKGLFLALFSMLFNNKSQKLKHTDVPDLEVIADDNMDPVIKEQEKGPALSSHVYYSTDVITPVCSCWKCKKCNTINISSASVIFNKTVACKSLKTEKHTTAKIESRQQALLEYKGFTTDVIAQPLNNVDKIGYSLQLYNHKCKKCGSKPNWQKTAINKLMPYIFIVSMIVAVATSYALFVDVFDGKTITDQWIAPSISILIACGIIIDSFFVKKLPKKTSEEFAPILSTNNKELLNYAKSIGKTILTPKEAKEKLESYGTNNTENNKEEIIDSPESQTGNKKKKRNLTNILLIIIICILSLIVVSGVYFFAFSNVSLEIVPKNTVSTNVSSKGNKNASNRNTSNVTSTAPAHVDIDK